MNRVEPGEVELMGVREIAELFGVTRQRVSQLAAGHADFPRPLAQLQMGPVFCGVSVREFLASWDRRPGRPPIHREITRRDV